MPVTFTNVHGQEPSPALPPAAPPIGQELDAIRKGRQFAPIVQRVGREGIDVERCQAPTGMIGMGKYPQRVRCDRPASCVIVENNPRPDGAIGGMALCELCYKVVLVTQGPDYAHVTPL